MVRIQLHMTAEQDRQLRTLAERRGLTRAELIRRGIDLVLAEDREGHDALLELVGAAGTASRDDVSEHHDEVLYGSGESLTVPLPRAAEPGGDQE
jgi:hypothetical protein